MSLIVNFRTKNKYHNLSVILLFDSLNVVLTTFANRLLSV